MQRMSLNKITAALSMEYVQAFATMFPLFLIFITRISLIIFNASDSLSEDRASLCETCSACSVA